MSEEPMRIGTIIREQLIPDERRALYEVLFNELRDQPEQKLFVYNIGFKARLYNEMDVQGEYRRRTELELACTCLASLNRTKEDVMMATIDY